MASLGITQKISRACPFLPLFSFTAAHRTVGKRAIQSGFTHVGLSFAGGAQLKGGVAHIAAVILLDKHLSLASSLEGAAFV